MTVGVKAVAYAGGTLPRELSRFFMQIGHEITDVSSGNNYQKCRQKLGVCILKTKHFKQIKTSKKVYSNKKSWSVSNPAITSNKVNLYKKNAGWKMHRRNNLCFSTLYCGTRKLFLKIIT